MHGNGLNSKNLKIYSSIAEFSPVGKAVVTIGTFDGVHFGHQKIIARLKEIAQSVKGEVVLLTFFPHPRMVLFPGDHGLQLLNTMDEKILLLEKFGIDHLIVHPFSKEFSRTSSTEFVRDILVNKIGVKRLVIGYDHHFGRNREGSFEDLSELAPLYNFLVEKIPEEDVNHVAVSSTKIRNALLEGDVKTAHEFSGYYYSITGTVIEGKKIGKDLGYPTANIEVKEDYKLIPANGIYAVYVSLGKNPPVDDLKNAKPELWMKGMMSIGTRPTFDNGPRSIEVNIFDFDGNIYGKELTVSFISRIRDEKKFSSVDLLVKEIERDKIRSLELLQD